MQKIELLMFMLLVPTTGLSIWGFGVTYKRAVKFLKDPYGYGDTSDGYFSVTINILCGIMGSGGILTLISMFLLAILK